MNQPASQTTDLSNENVSAPSVKAEAPAPSAPVPDTLAPSVKAETPAPSAPVPDKPAPSVKAETPAPSAPVPDTLAPSVKAETPAPSAPVPDKPAPSVKAETPAPSAPVSATPAPSVKAETPAPSAPVSDTPAPSVKAETPAPSAPVSATPAPSVKAETPAPSAPVSATPAPSVKAETPAPSAPVPDTLAPSVKAETPAPSAPVPDTPAPSVKAETPAPSAPVTKTLAPKVRALKPSPSTPVSKTPTPEVKTQTPVPVAPVTNAPAPKVRALKPAPSAPVSKAPTHKAKALKPAPSAPVSKAPTPEVKTQKPVPVAPVTNAPAPSVKAETSAPSAPVSKAPTPGVQTEASIQSVPDANASVPAASAEYEGILLEKRSHWLFRIQFCLIFSILAHIGLLAYLHDKFIILKVDLAENSFFDVDKSEPIPMPVQEPKVVSGYDESRLDSPEIQDSFEQLTPTSPAEEQEFNDEKTQPSVDEFNSSLEHEFQTPDSPELSEVPNITPIEENKLETPSEEVPPDISRKFNTEFNPSNLRQNIPLPEHERLVSTVQHERPQSDFGSMGQQNAVADSSQVVLDAGETESIQPSVEDPTILEIPKADVLPELGNQMPEQSISSVPDLIQPVTSLRPSNFSRAKETDILVNASSSVPKAQTRAPVVTGPRGLPRASYDTPTAYSEQTAQDISNSIVLDSPKNSTTVPIPRDFNAGFGGLNGDEFSSLDSPPEAVVSIGAPSIIRSNSGDVPSDAYSKRDPTLRPEMITRFGGDASINQTIENGLKYLSKTQWPDGRWRFHQQPATLKISQKLQQNGSKKCDTAATALALLSMLGAGYTHKDGLYQEEIQKGLDFLIDHQQTVPIVGKNGVKGAVGAIYDTDDVISADESQNEFYNYRSYAHAMATIALCEAYGLTRDPQILPAAQAAVRYIIATQNPRLGGWRYETQGMEGQPHIESDTSSSGWQVMALRSAIAAKVLSPEEVTPVLNNVQIWLNRAQNPENKRYIYNPDNGMDSKYTDWKKTTPAMTAEGLFMQWCINPDIVDSQQIIPYLLQNAPGRKGDSAYQTDVYYWYYGTTVMFAQKGEAWKAWQSAVMPLLRDTQLPANHPCGGSWDTESPTIDKWSNIGGKHYITTMNLMIMEIYIRHLSIYQ